MLKSKKLRERYNPADLRDWVQRGLSIRTIAERMECCQRTARRTLVRLGLIERFGEPPRPPRSADMVRAGAAASMAPDAERDAMIDGDRNPAKADRVLNRRYGAVRARIEATISAIRVGEGDEGDEHEKRLRRLGAIR